MNDPYRPKPQREVITRDVSDRLLARAAELDAAERAAAEVARLRAAAAEAGISTTAFDAALDEMRGGVQPSAVQTSRRRARSWGLILAASALLLGGAVAVSRVAQSPAVPVVEQAFLLRCLPSIEAAELVRPMLEHTSTVTITPDRAPRVLTVKAPPQQMGDIGTVLERQDAACQAPTGTR
jgi:hypothetical protein